MLPNSLTGRLMLVAAVVVVFFLPLSGLVLERAYVNSLDSRLQEQLKIQIYSLMGLADELEPGELWLPEVLPDERFNQLGSGKYAQLTNDNGEILWRSQSSLNVDIPSPSKIAQSLFESPDENIIGAFHFKRLKTTDGFVIQTAQVTIIWEGPGDLEHRYTFQAAENLQTYFQEIGAFRQTLILWLGGLGLLLLLVNLGAMFWALKPFQRLSEDIYAIETGQQESLDTNYPRELKQIATNINALIQHEREQRRRYRNTLQDLAHSLKTPLSVVTSLSHTIAEPKLKSEISEQSTRMSKLISYQLQKAVSGGAAPIKQRVKIKPELEQLLAALSKVYLDKNTSVTLTASDADIFLGDQNDLLEMLGNLCDNAFKYGYSHVTVRCEPGPKAHFIRIRIIDDGDGIPENLIEKIFERGIRLDEKVEGQGIGLAVVSNIVASYRGNIQMETTKEGHCVILDLPGEYQPRA